VSKVGDLDWGGYVPRRPSNVLSFPPEGRLVLRTPHRFVGLPVPVPKEPTFRIKRPESSEAIAVNKKMFDPTTVSYEIDVPPGEALVLPVRLYSKEPMDIIARVDGDTPDRKTRGAVERVTVSRKIAVNDEVKSIVVLGDDLPAGKHILTFTPPPGKKAWVHLPWVAKPRLPGTPPPDPHWVEGDLED
jgi:hypothetical protein